MAIYRFEVKIIGRRDRAGGRSVVAAAAYRSGSNLRDDRYGKTHYYRSRAGGVEYSGIHAQDAPEWLRYEDGPGANYTQRDARQALWNAVEAKEDTHNRRASAQLAREFNPACPLELNREQRRELVIGFTDRELVPRGMVCDVSIHTSWDGQNPHAHILVAPRALVGEEFADRKNRNWNTKALLEALREAWATHCNAALEAAGREERVDHRSLAARGIDREPQPKIGVAAAAMQRRGLDTERAKRARWAEVDGFMRPFLRGIEATGETRQVGAGATWWERAQVAIGQTEASTCPQGQGVAPPPEPPPSTWQNYLARRQETQREGPEPDLG